MCREGFEISFYKMVVWTCWDEGERFCSWAILKMLRLIWEEIVLSCHCFVLFLL